MIATSRRSVIGSANASHGSTIAVEAVVITDDPDTVAADNVGLPADNVGLPAGRRGLRRHRDPPHPQNLRPPPASPNRRTADFVADAEHQLADLGHPKPRLTTDHEIVSASCAPHCSNFGAFELLQPLPVLSSGNDMSPRSGSPTSRPDLTTPPLHPRIPQGASSPWPGRQMATVDRQSSLLGQLGAPRKCMGRGPTTDGRSPGVGYPTGSRRRVREGDALRAPIGMRPAAGTSESP